MYGLWWVPWLWLILSEILCALTFRDNLVLGFIQTVSPQQWIKDYQQEIVPPHLRGIMRAGYWDNKVTRLYSDCAPIGPAPRSLCPYWLRAS